MEDIGKLYQKFLDKKCSPEEAEFLMQYFQENPTSKEILDGMEAVLQDTNTEVPQEQDLRIIANNRGRLRQQILGKKDSKFRKLKPLLKIAAIVLMTFSAIVAVYIFNGKIDRHTELTSVYGDDVQPGGNRATLTLADGKNIVLSETKEGIRMENGISYDDGTAIALLPNNNQLSSESLLTLSTPKAGQYKIMLPDGTKVWLNAESSLKYPSVFNGAERKVELVGEGYFEVTPNANKPFRVVNKNQLVEVLGTAFNINSYDAATVTTLIHGSVRVKNENTHPVILKPNQQAVLANKDFTVKNVEASDFTAWKDGLLMMNKATLDDIAKQIERWYDVEVVLSNQISLNKTASIMVNRNESLSNVMKAIQETYKVDIKIHGRRVTIQE